MTDNIVRGYTTYILPIVHNAGVVVRHTVTVDSLCGILLEVEFHSLHYIIVKDADILVSVWSGLLMLEPNCMSKLMNDDAFLQKKQVRNPLSPSRCVAAESQVYLWKIIS